jgi:hypothetical protein
MSDQHMNASDQGTQPDSGSAPNDGVNVNAAGGSPQGAPGSAGSQPDRTQGITGNKARVPEDGEGEQGYEGPGGKDNINHIKG